MQEQEQEQKQGSWQDLLKEIISDHRERQRIADELGVRPITLERWADKESEPRPQNLRHLVSVIPQCREEMLGLIKEETGEDLLMAGVEDAATTILSSSYRRIFSTFAITNNNMRYYSTCELILQLAIEQLDPGQLGMAIQVVRCMPPSLEDHKIHSLRESVGLGTPPWSGALEQKAMFLGAESLCGYVVNRSRPASNQNVDNTSNIIPAHKVVHEKSASAHPILCAGKIAGCVLVSSTQYNYFLPQSRLNLIEQSANLLALAFEPEEFYEPEDIKLFVMPNQEIQQAYFTKFQTYLTEAMNVVNHSRQATTSIETELLVWQRLERELLAET
jgi:hypothetical protein